MEIRKKKQQKHNSIHIKNLEKTAAIKTRYTKKILYLPDNKGRRGPISKNQENILKGRKQGISLGFFSDSTWVSVKTHKTVSLRGYILVCLFVCLVFVL